MKSHVETDHSNAESRETVIGKKINIIGSSGSGKSTFAQQLNLPYIEMDSLFWLADWQQPSDEQFFDRLQQSLSQNPQGWVLDGSYSRSIAIKWQDVDTVIWIHYPLARTLLQLTWRTLRRSLTKQELWAGTGNRESLTMAFLSKESIILWLLNNYHSQQQKNKAWMQTDQYRHIQFIELNSPKAVKQFLMQLNTNYVAST